MTLYITAVNNTSVKLEGVWVVGGRSFTSIAKSIFEKRQEVPSACHIKQLVIMILMKNPHLGYVMTTKPSL